MRANSHDLITSQRPSPPNTIILGKFGVEGEKQIEIALPGNNHLYLFFSKHISSWASPVCYAHRVFKIKILIITTQTLTPYVMGSVVGPNISRDYLGLNYSYSSSFSFLLLLNY